MIISGHCLGGSYLPYDPQNPNYEENIFKLAAFNPKHPEVRKYKRMIAETKVETKTSPEGLDHQHFTDPDLTQEDIAAVDEMLKMTAADQESEPQFKSNDEIERAFADGKI